MKRISTLRAELRKECIELSHMAHDFTPGSEDRFQRKICEIQLIKTEIVRRENRKK